MMMYSALAYLGEISSKNIPVPINESEKLMFLIRCNLNHLMRCQCGWLCLMAAWSSMLVGPLIGIDFCSVTEISDGKMGEVEVTTRPAGIVMSISGVE